MKKKVCIICGNEFETSNDSNICFCCTLRDLAGVSDADEEDVLTAKKQSGHLTDTDFDLLSQCGEFNIDNDKFSDEEDLGDWEYF